MSMADQRALERLKSVSGAHIDAVKLREQLAGTVFFKDFTTEELDTLASLVQVYRAERNEAVFIEGRYAGYLCIILSGRLDIIKETATGQSRPLTEMTAGAVVGEMSLVDHEPNSATVVAAEPTLLAALTLSAINLLTEQDPLLVIKLYRHIAAVISQRLRSTHSDLIDTLRTP